MRPIADTMRPIFQSMRPRGYIHDILMKTGPWGNQWGLSQQVKC